MSCRDSNGSVRTSSLFDYVSSGELFALGFEKDNARYASMIDGRTIHFHIQFVEPVLCRLFAHAAAPARPSGLGSLNAFSPRRLARHASHEHDAEQLASIRRGPSAIDVCSVSARHDGAELVSAALQLLDEHRLSFFVDLSIGVVRLSERETQHRQGVAVLGPAAGPTNVARMLLAAAAKQFCGLWMTAEDHEWGLEADHRNELCDCFSVAVSRELERRTGVESPPAATPEEARRTLVWLDTFNHRLLTRELIAVWYPYWSRSRFMFDSPLNTVASLKEVG